MPLKSPVWVRTILNHPSTSRDLLRREFLPAVPLYIEEDDSAKEAVKQVMEDIGNLLAQRMKAYKDGCREAGVAI